MTTKLYNTDTQQIIHTTYGGYYTVDGQRPQLPNNVIELVVVPSAAPSYNEETQRLTSSWEVNTTTLQYIQSWQVVDKTQYEIAMEDWKYTEYLKRIIAPKQLLFDDIGIKMYGWFQLNNLPVELIDDTYIYLWCNEILPEHQAIVDNLQGVIVIQDRPVEI
jgi:hypothetical protein